MKEMYLVSRILKKQRRNNFFLENIIATKIFLGKKNFRKTLNFDQGENSLVTEKPIGSTEFFLISR